MATFATVDVELNITGDVLPIVRAFGIMSAALAAYGHEFSDDEMTVIATAADVLGCAVGTHPELDFDPSTRSGQAANLEPSP